MPKSAKKKSAKNLYLKPEDVARGEAYGRRIGLTLSQLVTDLLRALPGDESQDAPSGEALAPAVRRLVGAGVPRDAAGRAADVAAYHEHLLDKYGRG